MLVRRSLPIAASTLLLALLLAAVLFHFNLQRTLDRTDIQVRETHELAFTLRPLRLAPNPGFESVAGPADLRTAARADDALFLAGPGELLEFTSDGKPIRTLRTGRDLPPFPLGSLLAARVQGHTGAQLLVATGGAGLLLLDPVSGQVSQLLPGIPALRDLTAVAALPSGDLLLGTRRSGVLRFSGGVLSYYNPGLRNTAVTAMLARDAAVYIGTENDGLYLDRAGVTQHLLPELPDPHIEALAAHGSLVFAATPDGVVQFQDDRLARTLARGTFAHALAADNHSLTLAPWEGGTVRLALTPDTGHQPIEAAAALTDVRVQQFLPMPDALYAVRADGLYRQRDSRWTPVLRLPDDGLTDANISALNFDPQERLWVGFFDRGLDIREPDGKGTHHLEDDRLFCVNRILTDPRRGTEDVATANGLVLFDRDAKAREVLTRRDGLLSDHVTDLAFTPDNITVATPAGLSFVSKAGVESLYVFGGLVNNHVYAVAVSPDGNRLLAGTLGGVSLLEHATVRTNLTVANSHLRHNWISAVAPLPAFAGGGFLLGTYGGGLMQLEPGGNVSSMPGSPPNAIVNPNAVLSTATHLYAGTLGRGLYVFGRAAGRWQPITAGLPTLNVTALTAHNGELYVGTDNGLVHIQEALLPQ